MTLPEETVTPVRLSARRCPATPEKVKYAFWPGTVVVTVPRAPPIVTELEASGGTL